MRKFTKRDWQERHEIIGVGHPFYVIEDDIDPEEGYTGSTLYGCDGDGGRFVVVVDCFGDIIKFELVKCRFIGECDFSIDTLTDWLATLSEHVLEKAGETA